MLYTYSFSNKKRDLSDVLSNVVKEEPRFISNFKTVAAATQQKHEWLEDQIGGRAITASAVASLVCTVSADDAGRVAVGTLLNVKGDSALFRVAEISGTSVTVALVAANGSTKNTPADGDVLNIVSTPMAQATGNEDGEQNYAQTGTAYNCTQIFRKQIILSGSALAINVYGGVDNQINRQTAFALGDLARDLNRVALFGRRVEPSASAKGEAGGLYFLGTQTGGLSVNAGGFRLCSNIINDAAQGVLAEGGEPAQILCSPGQARVLSAEYRDQLQIVRSDDKRGAYVAVVINDINGRGMTIIADPDVPDTDVWVIDPTGFGLSSLSGRGISDTDATPKGFDGVMRMALGELTFEFKNAKQRLCRISGLKSSIDALVEVKAGIPGKTSVVNFADLPTVATTRSLIVDADSEVPAASADNYGYTVRIGTAWTGGSKIATAAKDEVYASNGSAWIKQ